MRKLSYWLIAFVICCTVMDIPAYAVADSTELLLAASKNAIRKGDVTEVVVMAKPYEELYGVELKVGYDPDALLLLESTGIEYALFDSEAASPASGTLHLSAIAKPSAGSAAGTIAKLRFRALASGIHTEIKLTAVKGVSRERTTRERDGHIYPDLKEIMVHAATPLTIRLLPGAAPDTPADSANLSQLDIRQEPNALKAAALLSNRLGQPDIESDMEGWSALVRDTAIRLLSFHAERSEDGKAEIVWNEASLSPVLNAYHLLQQAAKAAGVEDSYPYAVIAGVDELDRTELLLSVELKELIKNLGLSLVMKNKYFTVKLEPESLRYDSSGIARLAVEPVARSAERIGVTRMEPIGSYRFQLGMLDHASGSTATVRWNIPERSEGDLIGVYRWNAVSGEWVYVREKERNITERSITTHLGDGEYGFLIYKKEFADLGSTYAEAAHAIRVLAARAVVSGTGGEFYGVERPVTRAEWAAMLMRASGLDMDAAPEATSANSFTDLDTDQWYAAYIAMASSQGWIKGYADGTYRPAERITRAELAVMLDRLWPDDGTGTADSLPGYRDDEDIPGWAESAIYRMRAQGMMQGDADNRFQPYEEVGRDDAAVILLRMIEAWDPARSKN